MKIISFFVCFLLLLACQSKKESEVSGKPNILFILVDDLGIKDLSYTGSKYYETPNIDRLANKSINFTQGYASSRVCSPSRASIMTGKFTATHGITDWIGAKSGKDWRKTKRHDKMLPADYNKHLNADDITLAEAFKMNGYKTFFAGKWHLGGKGNYPKNHGFDINVGGWEHGSPKGGYFSPYKNPNLANKKEGEQLSYRLAEETVSMLKSQNDVPFFAFLSFYAVHGPIQTQKGKWAKYRNKAEQHGISKKGFNMEKNLPIRLHQDNPVYAGLIENMDEAVGLVLDAIDELNLDKNTIIVFTSDNGGVASGDNYSTSNLPYKGGKGYQWEGGIREPYLIYIPGVKSKTIEFPVTGSDFYPTLLDLANLDLKPNQHQDGISLKQLIYNDIKLDERPLYWHYPHYGNQGGEPSSIIRLGNWKLIHFYESNTQQLYNMNQDPFEKKDLAIKYPKRKLKMKQQLFEYLNNVGAKFPKIDPKYNADERKAYMKHIVEKKLPSLEKQRLNMLSEDYQPNKNWWGSLTND